MEFKVKIPDSIYNKEPETWDRFAKAFQEQFNRMIVGACKYHYDKNSKISDDSPLEDYLVFVRERLGMYQDEMLMLCDCGNMKINFTSKNHSLNCSVTRLKLNTGNTENLLDAANGLILEFLFPKHLKAHFRSQTSSESPGIIYK